MIILNRKSKFKEYTLNNLLIIFTIIILIALSFKPVFALSEEQEITSSGGRLTGLWKDMLSDEQKITEEIKPGYWGVTKYKFNDISFGYDIQRTNSLVSPYKLIINFKGNFVTNQQSPYANSSSLNGKWYGFKTREEAVNHATDMDFSNDPISCEFTVIYAYQDGFWTFKGGNDLFDFRLQPLLSNEALNMKFQKLLKVPVKDEVIKPVNKAKKKTKNKG